MSIFWKMNVSTRVHKNGHKSACDQYLFTKLVSLYSAHIELSIHAKTQFWWKIPNSPISHSQPHTIVIRQWVSLFTPRSYSIALHKKYVIVLIKLLLVMCLIIDTVKALEEFGWIIFSVLHLILCCQHVHIMVLVMRSAAILKMWLWFVCLIIMVSGLITSKILTTDSWKWMVYMLWQPPQLQMVQWSWLLGLSWYVVQLFW